MSADDGMVPPADPVPALHPRVVRLTIQTSMVALRIDATNQDDAKVAREWLDSFIRDFPDRPRPTWGLGDTPPSE